MGPKQYIYGDNQGQDTDYDERYERDLAREMGRVAWDKSVTDRMIGPSKDDDDEVFFGKKGHW